MNLAGTVLAAVARAALVALGAWLLAGPLARLLAPATGRWRSAVWALLLAPLLTPMLLVSYVYARFATVIGGWPFGLALFYSLALFGKFAPVAVLIRHALPPPLSDAAWHAHALLARPRWQRLRFHLRGTGRGPWVAGGVIFLLTFSDFELASLWSFKTWTVVLFDAQTGGLAFADSLRLAAGPLAVQLAALAPLAFFHRHHSLPPAVARPLARRPRHACIAYLVVAAGAASALPLALVLGQAAVGWRAIFGHLALGGDVLTSLAFALSAVACAWPLAAWVSERPRATLALAAPGLLGALLIALLVLALFQLPLFHTAYDSPLPLLFALTLLLLPLAVPLHFALAAHRRDPALHLAHLHGSRALRWQLDLRPRWLAASLLFCWAYFDFTAGSILAPIGLTPIFVRLHNLMHYGQTAVLSAMLLAAFAAPIATVLLAGGIARRILRAR